MVTRQISFSVGEYYHIYNRGVDKRNIFIDHSDRERFMKLLFVANGTNSFVFREFPIGLPYVDFERGDQLSGIGAYCLMPNHFHILFKEIGEGGISKMIMKLLTSYSSYFNKKYNRTGRLFEGTFKAIHVDTDEYLKYLFSYIHLNPIKMIDSQWKEDGIKDFNRACAYLNRYKYSSYLDYVGVKRIENNILDIKNFPEYFSEKQDFTDFINEWLLYKDISFT